MKHAFFFFPRPFVRPEGAARSYEQRVADYAEENECEGFPCGVVYFGNCGGEQWVSKGATVCGECGGGALRCSILFVPTSISMQPGMPFLEPLPGRCRDPLADVFERCFRAAWMREIQECQEHGA